MLGYSDSGKDGGFLAASWGLHRAESMLARACRAADVEFRFFHGRGGTIARGGGRASRAIKSTPAASRNGRVRVTEQGEVVSFRYASQAIAHRHLEQLVGAMMISLGTAAPDAGPAPSDRHAELMTALGERSMREYRRLIDDERFWPWFERVSPVRYIARMNIASRPVSRAGGTLDLGKIRAIPWVFSWTQMRFNVPGWYGLGSAATERIESVGPDEFAELYAHWPFFAEVIDNAQQEMARARLPIAMRYGRASEHPLHQTIAAEFERAERAVLAITGQDTLLANNPVIRDSIHRRNPDADVLNLLQLEVLARSRANPQDETITELVLLSMNGVAAAMQSTG